jgi:hypothetical protein
MHARIRFRQLQVFICSHNFRARRAVRTLKDLDQSAAALAEACHLLLDPDVPDESLRKKVFAKILRAALENALDLERVSVLIRPPDDVYYQELSEHYRSVRGYLPLL